MNKSQKEFIKYIEEKLEKTSDDLGVDYIELLQTYIKSNDDIKIVDLSTNSDKYDFYLKWRNDIDYFLVKLNYFNKKPSDMNIYSIYDYIIKSVDFVILNIVKYLLKKYNK